MCRQQPINPRVVCHLHHNTVIDTAPISFPNSSSTFESKFSRFMHDNKLDSKEYVARGLGRIQRYIA